MNARSVSLAPPAAVAALPGRGFGSRVAGIAGPGRRHCPAVAGSTLHRRRGRPLLQDLVELAGWNMGGAPVIGIRFRRGPHDVAGGLDRQEFDRPQKSWMA